MRVCVFHECVSSCIYTYTHPHTHTPTNKHTRTHTHTCIYLLTHIHTDLYRSTNIYACLNACTFAHTHRTQTHAHILAYVAKSLRAPLLTNTFHTSLSRVKCSCTHPHTFAQLWRQWPLQAPVHTYWHWRHNTCEMKRDASRWHQC